MRRLFWFTVSGHSPWYNGRHGSRNMRQLVTLSIIRKQRKRKTETSLAFSFFFSSECSLWNITIYIQGGSSFLSQAYLEVGSPERFAVRIEPYHHNAVSPFKFLGAEDLS